MTASPAPPRIAPRPPGGGAETHVGGIGDEPERRVARSRRRPGRAGERLRRLPSNAWAGPARPARQAVRAHARWPGGRRAARRAPACARHVARLQRGVRGLERQSHPTPARACGREHPLPAGRLRVQRRVPGRHVACRIAGECPLLPGVAVGAVARADAAGIGRRQRSQTAGLERPRRCAGDRSRPGRSGARARPAAGRRSSRASGTPMPRAPRDRPPRRLPSAGDSAGGPSPAHAVGSARPFEREPWQTCPRASHGRSDGPNADSRLVSEPLRGGDSSRLRGLGGHVPVLRALRRGAARGRRAALLVLELDALPGADARVRRDLHRHRLPGARLVAEPRLRRPAGDGHRLPLHQRLHLHLRQPGHRSGEDRRARRVLPAARRATTTRTGTSCTRSGARRWRR